MQCQKVDPLNSLSPHGGVSGTALRARIDLRQSEGALGSPLKAGVADCRFGPNRIWLRCLQNRAIPIAAVGSGTARAVCNRSRRQL